MTQYTYLTGAELVLPEATISDGALLIADGRIDAILPDAAPRDCHEVDLSGAILLPGLIDLHSDAVESLAEPRPGVYFPFDHAAAQIDRTVAMCGITTFYNAISFAGEELGLRNDRAGVELVNALHAYRRHALVDQRIHCRFEVTCGKALPAILGFIEDSICDLASYMDHSPGQGQFKDEAAYRDYMSSRYGYGDETVNDLLDRKWRDSGAIHTDLANLAAGAAVAEIPMAGHDSDSLEHIETMKRLGAVISEFPMNRLAARAGREAGLHQLVGSTNVVRGGSQRTGMRALDVVEEGLADCLCSDYVPSTLLPALFKIAEELSRPLHEAVKLATHNPASAAGLSDRGSIVEGKLADLCAVRIVAGLPLVQTTWRGGVAVFGTQLP